jgi:hypothetical protein
MTMNADLCETVLGKEIPEVTYRADGSADQTNGGNKVRIGWKSGPILQDEVDKDSDRAKGIWKKEGQLAWFSHSLLHERQALRLRHCLRLALLELAGHICEEERGSYVRRSGSRKTKICGRRMEPDGRC